MYFWSNILQHYLVQYLYLDIVTGAGSFPEFAVTAAGVVFPVVCRGSVRLCRAFRNENPVSNQNGRHMPVTLTTWGKKIASSFADENSHSLFNFAPGIPEWKSYPQSIVLWECSWPGHFKKIILFLSFQNGCHLSYQTERGIVYQGTFSKDFSLFLVFSISKSAAYLAISAPICPWRRRFYRGCAR